VSAHEEQRARAATLRTLHHLDRPLLLPNAWDVASALAVERAGFPAVATTSAGVAASLGFDDHEKAPRDEMFAALERIAASVQVPVTADIEAGYGLAPDELAARLLAAGVAGCNLDDTDHRAGTLAEPVAHAADIAALLGAARDAGGELVVNARVDVFLRGDDGPQVLDDAVARATAYRAAGAACVYPILADAPTLSAFVARVAGPVNAMARRGAAPLSALLELPLARISFAGALQRLSVADLAVRLGAIASGDDGWDRRPGE
jgi:2-methylisocitrate lyase-like PEP mutase family enzyme